ncbi:metallophosphoesterase [Methanobrevibacter sp. OttesenSCG-928-K11]|nr:metallophosphoesterase [Methanobrevibacter sp. OttesenSCG-928-K11]
MSIKNKLLKFPKKGKLFVVTDLHGNLKDYETYLNLWEESDSKSHILFTGDLIHSTKRIDNSLEILDDAMDRIKDKKFHLLLGNHEWAHITNVTIYKEGVNQNLSFEQLVGKKHGFDYLDNYIDFFKKMNLIAKTANGVFISHGGPSILINSIDDFNIMLQQDSYLSKDIKEFFWNRPKEDYFLEDVDNFLKSVNSKVMVVGHTPVNGSEIFGKQLILSSSFSLSKKSYLELDLTYTIENMGDLLKFVKNI